MDDLGRPRRLDGRLRPHEQAVSRLKPLLTRFLGWMVGVFFHVERRGQNVPPGPLVVVANHPNSLMDPLVLMSVLDRPTRPLAKAPLFEQRILGHILKALGGLPVYRKQDFPDQMRKNQGTFDAAIQALNTGAAIQIYPEGLSHSGASLAPLRTGAARIALQAEEESDWNLGLTLLPVGLTYVRKSFFRGRVVASVGTPIRASDWKEKYEANNRDAVRELTDGIRDGLEEVTLNVESPEERDLIDVAERIYSRESGLTTWRERDSLASRFPRLQTFARGAAWLRTEAPDEYNNLARRVRAYERAAGLLGAGEAGVPPAYEWKATVRYALVQGGLILLEAPFAAVGFLAWIPVYLGSKPIVKRIRPAYEALSTYKLSSSALLAFLTLLGWTTLAWWLGGIGWAVGVGALLVPLGLLAIAWHERWIRVEEDVRLFLRVAFRRDRRLRMAELRKQLVEEFDRIGKALPG